MSVQEGEGFVVRDRRSRSGEGGAPSDREASAAGSAREASSGPSALADHPHEPGPPVTFSSFVFSLGTSALMFMGEQLDPREERPPVNLAQAKEIIDILSVLEGKTRGNLTSEEQTMLEEMLYALRMKYVSLAAPSAGPGVR